MAEDNDQKTTDNVSNTDTPDPKHTQNEVDSTENGEIAQIDEATNESAETLGDESNITVEEAEKSDKERFKVNVGDTVVVNYKVIEGKKSRIQPFEGIIIAKKGHGMSRTFTVRRIGVAGIGVERIFPFFSPNIESLKIKSKGKVRRAKLYYLRDRIGKAATKV